MAVAGAAAAAAVPELRVQSPERLQHQYDTAKPRQPTTESLATQPAPATVERVPRVAAAPAPAPTSPHRERAATPPDGDGCLTGSNGSKKSPREEPATPLHTLTRPLSGAAGRQSNPSLRRMSRPVSHNGSQSPSAYLRLSSGLTPNPSPTGSRRACSSFGAYMSNCSPAWSLRGPITPLKPVWEEDSKVQGCGMCAAQFTFSRRKHHCRRCGRIVCSRCSASRRILPGRRVPGAQPPPLERVCDGCVDIIDSAPVEDQTTAQFGPLNDLLLKRAAKENVAQVPIGEGWGEVANSHTLDPLGVLGTRHMSRRSSQDGQAQERAAEQFECAHCSKALRFGYRCGQCTWCVCRECHSVLRWRDGVPSEIEEPEESQPASAAVSSADDSAWLSQYSPEYFPCALPPPPWVPDCVSDLCALCESAFTLLKRRHHCRGCGRCICGQCSTSKHSLPELGQIEPRRLCEDCAGLAAMGGFAL